MLNWDDLRFVLAVTRMGSALGAARTLGVNQTTVVRRIAQMEEVLGGVLFERMQSGLRLTPFGQRVATAAARVESEILALESALHAQQRVFSGKIRFTCSEAMANIVVMPCLREFRSKYPDIIVDLIADDRFLDLAVEARPMSRCARHGRTDGQSTLSAMACAHDAQLHRRGP
jgi:molybdate transport repressor ModE-like protein